MKKPRDNEMSASRINWIDSLKLIGMFYIYLGHLGNDAGKLYLFVFSFHVPLFFFISGIVFKGSRTKNELLLNTKKSFLSIVVPYIVFSLIGVAFLVIKNQIPAEEVSKILRECFRGIRNNVPLGSLWFLPCLFVVIIYHSVLEVIFKRKIVIFLIAFMFYIFTPYWWDGVPKLFFNVDSALYYLVFFSFGYLISDKLKGDWIAPNNNACRLVSYFILAMSLVVMVTVYYKTTYYLLAGFNISAVQYVISFFITVLLFVPSIALAKYLQLPSILMLGRNSLLLCGTEQIIKLTTFSLLSIFGISYRLVDPIDAVVYTCLCFVLSYFTTLKLYTHIKNKTA